MTTIAFRSNTIAADTLIAYNNITNGQREKITQCGRYTVALAGLTRLRTTLENWCRSGCPENNVPKSLLAEEDNFAALIIDNETGQPYEFDSGHLVPVYADYTAIGSGALLAIGAMAHGASAKEAVEAAARHDKNTGGSVTSLSFPLAA